MNPVFYIITECGEVNTITAPVSSDLVQRATEMGNCFRNRSTAEAAVARRKVLMKLVRLAALSRLGEGDTPSLTRHVILAEGTPENQALTLVKSTGEQNQISPQFADYRSAAAAIMELGSAAVWHALRDGWLSVEG